MRNLSFGLGTFLLAALRLLAAPNFTLILGQPTDRSVTVNVRADTAVEM